MDSINTGFKNLSIKQGKTQISRNEYIESIKKRRKLPNTKSFDISFQKFINFSNKLNNIDMNKNLKSSSHEKEINIKTPITNITKKQIVNHKKTNSLTIDLDPQNFKKKNIIKVNPQKKQTKIIYKNRNRNNLDMVNSNEENNTDNIICEPIIINENLIEKEKESSTLSTSQRTNPEKINNNNESFEKLDSIIINKDDNRRAKYFIKTTRNKLKNSVSSINFLNSINFSNNRCLSSRNFNNNFDNRKSIEKNNTTSNFFHRDLCLNIEDLIMIEDKFNKLIKALNEENINFVNKICFEWWNYYFNCSFKGNCDYLFNEQRKKNLITHYNSLLLISMMLIYDLSLKSKIFCKIIEYMNKIVIINYQSYLNICLSLINRIKPEYLTSKWVDRLKEIIYSKTSKNTFLISSIEQNLISINQILLKIINTYGNNTNILNPKIQIVYKNYLKYDSDSINKIFMGNIIYIENKGGSIIYSSKKQSNPLFSSFLPSPPLKELTLVLDLDETIMSFIYINEDNKEGLLRIRPYLYNFLNLIKSYYEIVIFTTATSNYADPLIDNIEIQKGKYFDYRLYREHCTIRNNDIIKDISLIGRDLSKIIIVDNIQQNFKLQKENGILISSFWGEDDDDKVLLQLGRILVSIAIDMIENDYDLDIRDEIKKYKEDIIKNVSIS